MNKVPVQNVIPGLIEPFPLTSSVTNSHSHVSRMHRRAMIAAVAVPEPMPPP
jgi:hypothetical protein